MRNGRDLHLTFTLKSVLEVQKVLLGVCTCCLTPAWQVNALLDTPPRQPGYSATTTVALHSQLTDFISIGRRVLNGDWAKADCRHCQLV